MKKLFLVTVVFFLVMIAHSEAQPGQKGFKVKKESALWQQIPSKVLLASKLPMTLKSKTRKWKNEMAAGTKGYGFAKLRAFEPPAKQLHRPAPYFLWAGGHIQQVTYAARATKQSLIISSDVDKDSGVNIELSRKATLSFDFGADPSDDSDEILADNTGQDIDITVGLSFAIR